MRILDFTSSVDTSSKEIVSIETVHEDLVPPIVSGNLFAQDGKLFMFGGEQGYFSTLLDNGTYPYYRAPRPSIGTNLFVYDISTKNWTVTDSGISNPPSGANFAYDSKEKTGWVYGGIHTGKGYFI